MDSDSDDYQHSDTELNDAEHKKFIENVLNLSRKQHVKKPSRTEPTLNVSEYDLVKTGKNVKVNDLTRALKQKSKHVTIGKKVLSASKSGKTLAKPLERPVADRIRRSVAYDGVKKTLDRWEPIVTSNRAADLLKFPIEIGVEKVGNQLDNFRLKSKLMEDLEALEPKMEVINVEMEQEFPLTTQEILEKRKEAAKMRAQQSYREAKARRQSKIKSKKYHRIMKREKVKEQLKEFELLQKTDPEAALAKLDEIEKARAEERMSLKHKSTGKWAKSKQIRAKYDSESRKVLAQQLAISRELTQKLQKNEDSESEPEETAPGMRFNKTNGDNPWTNLKVTQEVGDFVSGYRKYWEDSNSMTSAAKKADEEIAENETIQQENEKTTEPIKEINMNGLPLKVANKRVEDAPPEIKSKKRRSIKCTTEWDVTETNIEKAFNEMDYNLRQKLQAKYNKLSKNLKLDKGVKKERMKKIKAKVRKIDLKLNKKITKPIIDEAMNETAADADAPAVSNDIDKLKQIIDIDEPKINKQKQDIDPNKFVKVKSSNLKSDIPDLLDFNEEEDASDNDQRDTIAEAFEDDDVIDEFQKEKKENTETGNPKSVDLSLPGWGSWGGKDVKVSQRKNRRFITKFPKKMPRRDRNNGQLIINEKANNKVKALQVSEVPFPFKTVKDFEASIRAPCGRTFVPENAFRKLTKPSLVTKIGAVIDPMDEDVLLKKKKT